MSNWPPMDGRGPHVTTADVAAFEQRCGFQLPEDYRAFLLDVNGGRTADTHAEFSQGVVNQLYSLNDSDDESDLLTSFDDLQKDFPSLPLLYIGHDDGGARLLLALDGEHRGEVWLQVIEARPHDANPRVLWHDRRGFTKLADSFTAFMTSLGPLP